MQASLMKRFKAELHANSSYKFSLEVPLTVSLIVNAWDCIELTFWWNEVFYVHNHKSCLHNLDKAL